MASFFRASCAIYWLTWLISLSYVLGATVYELKYIPHTDEYEMVSTIIKILCYANLSLAIVGCVFVKCDVSHIVCFLLYVVPLLIGVPGFCVYGIVKLRTLKQGLNHSELIDMAQTHWKLHKRQPPWVEKMEIDHKCCGIISWKDYSLFIFNGIPDSAKVNSLVVGIPPACCKNYTSTEEGSKHCVQESIILPNDPGNDHRSAEQKSYEQKFYGDLVTDPKFPFINKKFEHFVDLKGCNNTINKAVVNLNSAHFTFLIILIIMSLLMLLVYVKSWCDARHFSSGRSDHSLDVENISLLDIPGVDLSVDQKSIRNIAHRAAGSIENKTVKSSVAGGYVPKSVTAEQLSRRSDIV